MADIQLTATFIVLSLIGLVNASYLLWKHYKHRPLLCPLNHDCSIVTESRWSHILGVRNEVLGALFFASMLAAISFAFFLPGLEAAILFWILVASAGSLIFSVFLIFVQIYAIRNYCFYCIISAVITLLLFLNSLLLMD